MKKEWLFFYTCFSISLCCTELSACFFPGLYPLVLLCIVIPLLVYALSGIVSCLPVKNSPGKNPSFRLIMYGSTDSKEQQLCAPAGC